MTLLFFFQAEDGIRDLTVTGVQTCALPILLPDPDGRTSRRRSCANHTTGAPRSYSANTPLPRPGTIAWMIGQDSACRPASALASSPAASRTYCAPCSARNRAPSQKSLTRGLTIQGYPIAAAAA